MNVGCALSAQDTSGRGVNVAQQPVSNSVVRNGLKSVVHRVQLRKRAQPCCACQRYRVVRREPADRSAQVDIRPQHRAALAFELHGDHTLTYRLSYCAAEGGQQDRLNRPAEPAPAVVQLGCLLDA
ncbi:Uncharacterised protein [Mycobacterium tuberculosis]|nr:Uncharacterised protein [Mycobacterium tuberculosis]